VNAASGTPFNITTGSDNNGDGIFTDRPALLSATTAGAIVTRFGAFDISAVNGNLPRNYGTNPPRVTVDLDLGRSFSLSGNGGSASGAESGRRYQLTANVRVTNLFNHTNVLGFSGVLTSPFFGRANIALPPRHIELALRFRF